MDSDAEDSEAEYHAQQDKILLNEVTRHSTSRDRKRTAEIQPVGLESDSGDDDDEDEEEEAQSLRHLGQYRDLLRRAELREFRKEIVSDDDDEDDDDEDEDGGVVGSKSSMSDANWAANRRFRYAGANEEEREEAQEEEDEEAARLMREERQRIRRRLQGAGRQSDLPAEASLTSAAAATSAAGHAAKASAIPDSVQGSSLLRISGELQPYQPPADATVRADPHQLQLYLQQHCPDMARVHAAKCRIERQLRKAVGVDESRLTRWQQLLKWHYILLCTYLRMRATNTQSVHRHPICRLLSQSAATVAQAAHASGDDEEEEAMMMTDEEDEDEEDVGDNEEKVAKDKQQQHRPIYREMQKNIPVQLHRQQQKLRKKKKKAGESNPRLKLRHKYKKALVRRRSQVPEVRPEINRYSGEAFGIRAGLVKSRKFK